MKLLADAVVLTAFLPAAGLEPVSDQGELGLEERAVTPEDGGSLTNDWVIFCILVGVWVVGNALWTSPPTTFLGSLRELAHRTSVEHLYLGLPFAAGGAKKRGYLSSLNTHRAKLYVDESVAAGTDVDLDVDALPHYPKPAAPLRGHVRGCEPLDRDGTWFLALIDLTPRDDRDASCLMEFIQTLRREESPEPQT